MLFFFFLVSLLLILVIFFLFLAFILFWLRATRHFISIFLVWDFMCIWVVGFIEFVCGIFALLVWVPLFIVLKVSCLNVHELILNKFIRHIIVAGNEYAPALTQFIEAWWALRSFGCWINYCCDGSIGFDSSKTDWFMPIDSLGLWSTDRLRLWVPLLPSDLVKSARAVKANWNHRIISAIRFAKFQWLHLPIL